MNSFKATAQLHIILIVPNRGLRQSTWKKKQTGLPALQGRRCQVQDAWPKNWRDQRASTPTREIQQQNKSNKKDRRESKMYLSRFTMHEKTWTK